MDNTLVEEFDKALREQKLRYNESIKKLIQDNVIRNMSDVARKLGYTRGAVSEMLNVDSKKNISVSFMDKFNRAFLNPKEVNKPLPNDVIKELQATNEILIDTLCLVITEMKGSNFTLTKANLMESIKKLIESKSI